MGRKAILALVALAGIGGLIWGGMAWRHASQCSALEDRFLNAISKDKSAGVIAQLGSPDVLELTAKMQKEANAESERAITELATDCGDDAAQTAIRKGYELIGG